MMNNRIDTIEQRLTRFYQAPVPDEAFAGHLEQDLRRQVRGARVRGARVRGAHMRRIPPTGTRSTLGFWRRGWAVPATLAVFTIMLVTLLGPQQVWAAIQGWIGFIPHFGFTQVEDQLVLAEPVTVSRGGVNITVDQVNGSDRFTSLVFSLKGGRRPSQQQLQEEVSLLLRLPDGSSLEAEDVYVYSATGSSLKGQVLFPAIPSDTRTVSLEVAAPANPDLNLSIPLKLRRAARPGFADAYIEPHVPENAIATTHGVTLTVTQAVYGSDAAAFELEAESPWWFGGVDPHTWGNDGQPILRDQTGYTYSRFYSALPPYRQQAAHTYTFVPVRPDAESLELHVPRLIFWVPLTETLSLQLGDEPQIGQQWPLDLYFEVAGIQAHITSVTLVQISSASLSKDRPYTLQFRVSGQSEDGNRWLRAVHGYGFVTTGKESVRGEGIFESEFSMVLPELPSGDVELDLLWMEFVLEGPWEITWDLP